MSILLDYSEPLVHLVDALLQDCVLFRSLLQLRLELLLHQAQFVHHEAWVLPHLLLGVCRFYILWLIYFVYLLL